MKVMPMLTPGKGQISWVCAQNEGQAKTHPAEFFPECRGGQGGKGKGKALPTWIPVSTRCTQFKAHHTSHRALRSSNLLCILLAKPHQRRCSGCEGILQGRDGRTLRDEAMHITAAFVPLSARDILPGVLGGGSGAPAAAGPLRACDSCGEAPHPACSRGTVG
eukprot:1142642-Pelagomonas_calceolata.AAC.12